MSDNNFEIKEDCFAYNPAKTLEKDRCNALINLFCKKEECRFYKKKKKGCGINNESIRI